MSTPVNAPYWGGFSPGANLFAVDGNFTQADPCGPPKIYWPFKGDSILSTRDIVVYSPEDSVYVTVKHGVYPNIQPWIANQRDIILEQEFMVAQSAFIPARLNSLYNPAWSLGWEGVFGDGQPTVNLGNLILVEIGTLEDCGGGISKFTMKFANLPFTRNDIEQFIYTYPGYDDGLNSRKSFSKPVPSRIQFDYFVFDDWNVLDWELFPDGARLNSTTGAYPSGLLLPPQYFYTGLPDDDFGDPVAVANNLFLEQGEPINDASDSAPGASIPSLTNYKSFVDGTACSNGLPAELIAEGSTITRWMGNIWERRTRFVPAL